MEPLLVVRGLKTEFSTPRGLVRAVDGVDLDIGKGEVLGLVGESGCGKSVTALSIMYLIPEPPGRIASGQIWFQGTDLLAGSRDDITIIPREGRRPKIVRHDPALKRHRARMNKIRGREISMIFQEPMSSLNPVLPVGYQVAEVLLYQRRAEICDGLLSRRDVTESDLAIIHRAVETADAAERDHLLADFCLRTGLSAEGVKAIIERSGLRMEERLSRIQKLASRRRTGNRWFLRFLKRLDYVEDQHVERQWKHLSRLSLGAPVADLFNPSINPQATDLPRLLRVTPREDAVRLYFRDVKTVTEELRSRVEARLREAAAASSDTPFQAIRNVSQGDGCIELRFAPDDPNAQREETEYRSRAFLYWLLLNTPIVRRVLSRPLEEEAKRHVLELLKLVRIPEPIKIYSEYPHELSGGMQQRVMIAIALACDPALMIADEPTTALDVTTQAQILKLIKDLRQRVNAAILYITHDLAVIAEVCDRVAVMYAGRIVEDAPVDELFAHPLHPYAQGLLQSIVSMETHKVAAGGALPSIPGTVPDLLNPPPGCRFHPRCPFAFDRCRKEDPMLVLRGERHKVACHLYDKGTTT